MKATNIESCAEVSCGCVLEVFWRVLGVLGVVAVPQEEWKPFHVRVEGIVSRIEACRKFIEANSGLQDSKGDKGSKEFNTLNAGVSEKWNVVNILKANTNFTGTPEEREKENRGTCVLLTFEWF